MSYKLKIGISIAFIFLALIITMFLWLKYREPVFLQLSLKNFESIYLRQPEKKLNDKDILKHLSWVSSEGLKAKIVGDAQVFSIDFGPGYGGTKYLGDALIKISQCKFIVADISDLDLSIQYDQNTKFYFLSLLQSEKKKLKILIDSKNLIADIEKNINHILYESSGTENLNLYPIEPENHHGYSFPSLEFIYPNNVSYWYSWRNDSSISMALSSLGDGKAKTGLYIQHICWDRSKVDSIMELSASDNSYVIFLVNKISISSEKYTSNNIDKKYLILVDLINYNTKIQVTMRGTRGNWNVWSAISNTPQFYVDPYNHKVSIQEPVGQVFVGKKKHEFQNLGSAFMNFYDFPRIQSKSMFNSTKEEEEDATNQIHPNYIIRGQGKSFLYANEEYVPSRWSKVPSEIRSSLIGIIAGFLIYIISRTLDKILQKK